MSALDIGIGVVLALAVVQGLRTGLVRTLFVLGGTVVGVVAAGQFSGAVAPALAPALGEGNASQIAAFVLVFLVVFVGASLMGGLVRHILNLTLLGWVDSLAGALLGFALGFVSTGFLLIALTRFPVLGLEGPVRESRLAPFLVAQAPVVLGLLPPDFRAAVEQLFR